MSLPVGDNGSTASTGTSFAPSPCCGRLQIAASIRHRENLPRTVGADGFNRDRLRDQSGAGFSAEPGRASTPSALSRRESADAVARGQTEQEQDRTCDATHFDRDGEPRQVCPPQWVS
jgi:hypothetical protein